MTPPAERPDPNALPENVRKAWDEIVYVFAQHVPQSGEWWREFDVLRGALLAAREPVASVEMEVIHIWGEVFTAVQRGVGVEVVADCRLLPSAHVGQRVRVTVHAIEPAKGGRSE